MREAPNGSLLTVINFLEKILWAHDIDDLGLTDLSFILLESLRIKKKKTLKNWTENIMSEWETFWKLLITAKNQWCYSTERPFWEEKIILSIFVFTWYISPLSLQWVQVQKTDSQREETNRILSVAFLKDSKW